MVKQGQIIWLDFCPQTGHEQKGRCPALVVSFGPVLTLPHSRKIGGTKDLYELRVQQGHNICRLFYFYHDERIYIVLSGFIKKQQKTDPKEIEKALAIRRKYVEDKTNETNETGANNERV
jgi:phage-related protein